MDQPFVVEVFRLYLLQVRKAVPERKDANGPEVERCTVNRRVAFKTIRNPTIILLADDPFKNPLRTVWFQRDGHVWPGLQKCSDDCGQVACRKTR